MMTKQETTKEFFTWLLEKAKIQTRQFGTFCKCVLKFEHLHTDVKVLTKKECMELQGVNRVVVVYFNRFLEEIEGRLEYRECKEDGTYIVLPLRDVFTELNPAGAGNPVYVYILKEDLDRFIPVTEVLDDLDIEVRTEETKEEDYTLFKEEARAVVDEMVYQLEMDKALKDRDFELARHLHRARNSKLGLE